MKDLLTTAGRNVLRKFITKNTLVVFDLDGTLAPIISEPSSIKISPEVRHLLQSIMSYAPVAVITGRSRNDALQYLGFDPDYLIGNHGAEGLKLWRAAEIDFRQHCRIWKEQLLPQLSEIDQGVVLEDKGTTLAVHYRSASHQNIVRTHLHNIVKHLTPCPRVVEGKCVINIVPMDAPHKGDALIELMSEAGVGQAFFVGDDVTDEDIFALDDQRILTVRVGYDGTSHADWFIKEQLDISTLLEVIHSILCSA